METWEKIANKAMESYHLPAGYSELSVPERLKARSLIELSHKRGLELVEQTRATKGQSHANSLIPNILKLESIIAAMDKVDGPS